MLAVREVVLRRIRVIIVVFGSLCVATTAAQRSPVALTEAESGVRAEKGAFLRSALMRESPVEPQRLSEAIRVALGDPDWAIRELALATVSGRTVRPAFTTSSAEMKREWERERPEMQRLRPMVVRALDDENDSVRRAAVGALQSLDFDGTQPYGRMLSAETTESLSRRYRREPSPTVRSFIVAVLGASAKQNPAAVSTVRDATRDEAAMVREMALRAMSELKP